jgi:hypothetical protein
LRIADDLQDSCAIAQIQKDHATMIPPAINPTAQANCLSDLFGIEVTAIVTTHHDF